MPQRPPLDTEFSQRFFADISALYPSSARRYDCPGISDIHYCQLGVLRCLSSATTGQQFLQHHADENVADIEPGHFFMTKGQAFSRSLFLPFLPHAGRCSP